MQGDTKVIEYLNKALRSELTAISQYWLHYKLQEDWGLGRMAKKSREESLEVFGEQLQSLIVEPFTRFLDLSKDQTKYKQIER